MYILECALVLFRVLKMFYKALLGKKCTKQL